MGIRFRKSKKLLPGVRLNVGTRGLSFSFGPRGLKHTISTTGRRTTTVGIPGSGLSFSETSGSRSRRSESAAAQEVGAIFTPTSARETSQKSRTIALLLCIFFGYLGIHRFYVGKKGTGVIWMFTAGVVGLGWIIDLVTIAIGGFYDSTGDVLRDWKIYKAEAADQAADDEVE